jgi:3-methylcrotonyl-CoA carboxylase beta subunit
MPTIISKIDSEHKNFQTNISAMEEKIDKLNKHLERIKQGGSERSKERQRSLGKLLVRERINQLIDKGSVFNELSLLAGFQLYEDDLPAGGIITGIGIINQHYCMIIANDASVKGGSYYPITVKKHLRAQEIAQNNHLPCIYLVDSGGAFLPKQDEVFPDKNHFGRIFFNQAQMSAKGIAQISVVMGSCTAGGAYIPCMSDTVIMVKNQATIFLAGPPLVKAATGEKVTAEELGGADVHCRTSGVADYYAESDEDAINQAREAINYLNQPKIEKTEDYLPPQYPQKNLLATIPSDQRMPTEIKEIIACLVDNSEFNEFKAKYGTTLICGFAHIQSHPVGIIANNGVLFSDSALKGAHFIQICNQRNIPLVFLQNISGFMVGKAHEANGIAKHGAKMVTAVSCAQVAKITVIVGGSYGAGNYAMCGRAFNPDFLYLWPNARKSVMGGEQAANVLTDIKESQCKRQNKRFDSSEQEKYKRVIKAQYEHRSSAYYSSAHLWDDNIINPLDTRTILGFNLRLISQSKRKKESFSYGIFRM